MTQDAKSYTEQSMLREAVRSLDMTVLHYDADCIIAFVDREPEIKHVILTESETGLYLVNAPIEKMGIEIAETLILPDHIPPTRRQLIDLAILAEEKGCEILLCSEKDWVKLPEPMKLSLPIAYVKASLQVVAQPENYEQLLKKILTLTQGTSS